MARRRCSIKDCSSVAGRQEHRGVTFHSFPLNPITRECWIRNSQIPASKIITKSVLICSRHFRRADFQPLKNDKYFLKHGAVPTIFPWGTLPYVEPAPPVLPIGQLINSNIEPGPSIGFSGKKKQTKSPSTAKLSDPESLISAIKSELKSVPLKRAAEDKAPEHPKSSKIMKKSDKSEKLNPISFDPVSLYLPGSRIEAQDFNGVWHFAKVVEVDLDEREVFITFENGKLKSQGAIDEWISMNSSRLRPVQPPKKPVTTYSVGDKCMARWTDSRKFPATVQKVLENNTYELLFDDGYSKIVRGSHMSKIRSTDSKSAAHSRTSAPPLPIPKFDLSELNLLPVPKDGEWCCNWVNDTPIGKEGYLDGPDGYKRPTVLVDDWRLPSGWTKHLYQRSSVSGKWDVVLVGPNKKRFRSKADVKVYLEEIGEIYNPDVYDFSIHKRRAKDIGLFIFTDDYKEQLKRKQQSVPSVKVETETATNTSNSAGASSEEPFTGFSLSESEEKLPETPIVSIAPLTVATTHTISTADEPMPETGFVYVGALKVQIVDNLFRCPDQSCNKNFRKENHLQIHVKHYHEEMAKLLGVCPNMTDLAYLRTMGQPLEESTPKNQIPNSQFFEKVYQSDMSMKAQRKSLSSPTRSMKNETAIKIEIKKEEITDQSGNELEGCETINNDTEDILKKLTKISESTIEESSFEKTFLVQDCIGHAVQPKPLPASKSRDLMDAEELIQTHSVTKPGSAAKKPGKRRRYCMKSRLAKILAKKAEAEQKEGKTIQPVVAADANVQESVVAQTDDGGVGDGVGIPEPAAKYINENGEMIKIVHMRQEEIINCLCSYPEEDGLMIQCELCLCWQHGGCNGIEKESQVPEKYVCYICQNPWRGRPSMKYVHDQDWLFDGKLPVANYKLSTKNTVNPKHMERFDILKQSHTLTGNLVELKQFMHSLDVKINIASNKDHPKMYLWAKKWENTMQPTQLQGIEPVKEEKMEVDSDIKQDESKGDELQGKSHTDTQSSLVDNVSASDPSKDTIQSLIPQPEAAIDPVECQRNLLDHIQKQQSLAMTRLETIEAHVIALEAMDEKLTSAEPIDSFVHVKDTIAMLLDDLALMRKLSLVNKQEGEL